MNRYFILDKFNTWYDWRLILTAKDITPPEPKTNLVDIDGMSGSLDLSESLTGETTYKDRTISATFWTDTGTRDDRNRLLREITTAIHGKKIKIIEPDDPTHYFYGRVKIKSQKNNLAYAEFTIEAVCDPWRYAIEETVRRIDVENMSGIDIVIHNNGVKALNPIITIDGQINIVFNGKYIDSVTPGTYIIPDIKLRQGVNIIRFAGLGSVSFSYREADL